MTAAGDEPAHQKLQHWWETSNADIDYRKRDPSDVDALAARYDFRLPDEFRDYLIQLGTTGTQSYDNELTNWWTLEEIKTVSEEFDGQEIHKSMMPYTRHLLFADHMLWCWGWAISFADDENFGSVWIFGDKPEIVAPSFSDFISQYIGDARLVSGAHVRPRRWWQFW